MAMTHELTRRAAAGAGGGERRTQGRVYQSHNTGKYTGIYLHTQDMQYLKRKCLWFITLKQLFDISSGVEVTFRNLEGFGFIHLSIHIQLPSILLTYPHEKCCLLGYQAVKCVVRHGRYGSKHGQVVV